MSTRPDRIRAYLELPSEQLDAGTPAEFAGVLARIMTADGLTASQVAIKAKIPRSQAYNMVSASRGKLPSRADQVRAFIEACDLAPVQVALVMDLWDKLDKQAREQSAKEISPAGNAVLPHAGSSVDVVPGFLQGNVNRFLLNHSPFPEPTVYRPKLFVDLLFLVLEDDHRTRRALKLLIPLLLAFVIVMATLTTWAVLQPGHANIIAAMAFAVITIPAAALRSLAPARRVTRTHRP